jgi:hypothetical protein
MKYIALILILCACSPAFHLDKFYKKGGKIEPIEKTITIHDTIKGKDGKDSLIYRTVTVECPQPTIETRWKTRFDNKRFKDSLKVVRIQYKDSLRYALRTYKNVLKSEIKNTRSTEKTKRTVTRQENKRSWWLFWVGLIVGIIASFLFKRLLSYIW